MPNDRFVIVEYTVRSGEKTQCVLLDTTGHGFTGYKFRANGRVLEDGLREEDLPEDISVSYDWPEELVELVDDEVYVFGGTTND